MASGKDRVYQVVATCFGLGYSPIFPGTAGALIGVVLFVPIAAFVSPYWLQVVLIALALILSCWVTIALAPWAEDHFSEKDSSRFVTDEVAGFLLTVLLWWPFYSEMSLWIAVPWSFLLTRVIDIIKIPPAKRLEKLPAGWGVVADDLLGSVYAAALLHVLVLVVPSAFGAGGG